jgi:hypothetical protein
MAGAAPGHYADSVLGDRGRNDMRTRLNRSRLAAHVAMILALTLVPGSFTVFAGKKGGGGSGGDGGSTGTTAPKPPTPANFRVTAKTAYTISVAWDPAPATSGDFNYHLSGAYHVTPAILPYVNGRFEDVVFGSGGPRVIYGTAFGDNLIEVFATDTAGNRSVAGTFRIFL